MILDVVHDSRVFRMDMRICSGCHGAPLSTKFNEFNIVFSITRLRISSATSTDKPFDWRKASVTSGASFVGGVDWASAVPTKLPMLSSHSVKARGCKHSAEGQRLRMLAPVVNPKPYHPTTLPTYLPTHPPTYLPTYPPTYLSTYLPTYLPTYLSTTLRDTAAPYLQTKFNKSRVFVINFRVNVWIWCNLSPKSSRIEKRKTKRIQFSPKAPKSENC